MRCYSRGVAPNPAILGGTAVVGKSGRREILGRGKVWLRRHTGCMARSRSAAPAQKIRRAPQTHGRRDALQKKSSKTFDKPRIPLGIRGEVLHLGGYARRTAVALKIRASHCCGCNRKSFRPMRSFTLVCLAHPAAETGNPRRIRMSFCSHLCHSEEAAGRRRIRFLPGRFSKGMRILRSAQDDKCGDGGGYV